MHTTPSFTLTEVSVRGEQGNVFGPITRESNSLLTLVTGPRGSGRTSLLLSITGRMSIATGTVTTLEETSAHRIRKMTGIAGFEAIDALEPQVTVGATIRERLGWVLPWYRRAPRIDQELAYDLFRETFGDVPLPGVEELIRDLTPTQELLLRVGLAMLEEPKLIAVDDLDCVKDPAERNIVIARLVELSRQGVAIVASTSDAHDLERFKQHSEINPAQISL